MALVNRLLAKEGGEDGGAAKEILAIELFREISFDDELPLQSSANGLDTTQEGPLGLLLRFNPSRRTSVQNEVSYNTLFSNLEDISFSATFGMRQNDSLGLRWTIRRDSERDLTQGNQVRLSAQLSLVPRVFQVASQVTYDIETKELQFQRYFFNFQGPCYHLSLELADLRNGDRRDREYRFLVSLKNVGTFLDMSGGESERF
jgi:lipopolysaccharide assembly outer membrane protein LptD (OstA)